MKNIAFFEFCNLTPHIETSLELVKTHADAGDTVEYFFLGHDVLFQEMVHKPRFPWIGTNAFLPEIVGFDLLKTPNVKFVPRSNIKSINFEPGNLSTATSLKNVHYKNLDVGYAALSSLYSYVGSDIEDVAPYSAKIKKMMLSSISVYEFVVRTLRSQKKDLVYLFNGRFCNQKAVLRACQAENVPFVVHERGASIGKYFSYPFVPHDRKMVQKMTVDTWNQCSDKEMAKKLAESWFQKRRKGGDTDTKSYVKNQQANLLPNVTPGKRLVTYYSSSNDEYAALGDLFQWTGWKNQMEAVCGLISVCKKLGDIELVIRLHPNLASKTELEKKPWAELQEKEPWVQFLSPTSPVDSYALALASNCVVTCGSKIGIEAAFLGRPSILLGPCYYDELNVANRCNDESALLTALSTPDFVADKENIYAYGYWWANFGEDFKYYVPQNFTSGKFLGVNLNRHLDNFKWIDTGYQKAVNLIRFKR